MLNKNQERELAYVVRIDEIIPIEGADRVEVAKVGGWRVMVRKGQFKTGDPAIYFEIDSKVPETEAFEFLAQKHYKVKTQKYFKGTVISQGLLMAAEDFGWTVRDYFIVDDKGFAHEANNQDSMFLTKKLGVTYYEAEDNKRKASSADKYQKMAQRMGMIQLVRILILIKKLLYLFYGRKGDKKNGWPAHIAQKTDVERIQNMTWVLKDKKPFVATEKIDGSSCSIMAERTRFGKIKYYICSRNVVFEDENQKCFYDDNVYFEAYHKYNLKEKITQILNEYNLSNVALQMEVFGPNIQKRDYSLKEHQAMIFHIVTNREKMPMDKVVEICEKYDLPHVPIVDDNYILPDSIEDLQKYVEGEGSKIDGKPREGIVFYDKETGQQYFKFVSPEFLLKYHS